MNTRMALHGLLFSSDTPVVYTMDRVLETFSMNMKLATSAEEALAIVQRQKFDIIFLDYKNIEIASSVVRTIRDSKLNHATMMMCITDDGSGLKDAFSQGVRLSMPRPRTVDQAMRCLRPAHIFVLRQRRKSIRFDTSIPVQIKIAGGNRLLGAVKNVSETGAALAVTESIRSGETASFDFQLPESKSLIRATGRIIWCSQDEAGVMFSSIPDPEQLVLEEWIADQIRISPAVPPGAAMRPRVTSKPLEITV